MKKYKLYLFDFDGTVVDSFPSLFGVFGRAFNAVGINITLDDVPQLAGEPLKTGFLRMGGKEEDYGTYTKEIEAALDSRETTEATGLFPDSMEFFNYVKDHNIPCGIVTSNKLEHVREVLDFLKIDIPSFIVFVGNREVTKHKPDPEPMLKALESVKDQFKPDEVVYVGDALNDALCAVNAHVDAILVDRDGTQPDSKDYLKISSLMELFK